METKDHNEVLVKVQNVSKKFCTDLKTSLKYGAIDIARSTLGLKTNKELRDKEFWAVNDVSFELRRGECIGLIGHNGAGKSTLLKVLNGLYAPDKGQITMKGKVTGLIELGAGFNPILTGRENVYNNAAILGFSREEVDQRMQSIIDFAEIEEFMDMPVKNYSSGMKVRLGFAIASHLEPDVLILDEVLAVGDAGFRIKSYNKMKEIMKNAAVIYVSHNMTEVARTCTDILFMHHGSANYQGKDIHQGIEYYFNEFKANEGKIESSEGAEISNFRVNNCETDQYQKNEIFFGENLKLNFEVKIKKPKIKEFFMIIRITDKDMKMVGSIFTNKFNQNFVNLNKNDIEITIPNLNLIDGDYTITYIVSQADEKTDSISGYLCIYRDYIKIKSSGLKMSDYAPIFFDAKISQNNQLCKN